MKGTSVVKITKPVILNIKPHQEESFKENIWVCGNPECINSRTGKHTVIAKLVNGEAINAKMESKQEVVIHFKDIYNICVQCGNKNQLCVDETITKETIED